MSRTDVRTGQTGTHSVAASIVRRRELEATAIGCAVCTGIATVAIFLTPWPAARIVPVAVLVVCSYVAHRVRSSGPLEAADVAERSRRTVVKPSAMSGLADDRQGEMMEIGMEGGRWYLGNGEGDYLEVPFAEIVAWLDTLWDIRQLASRPRERAIISLRTPFNGKGMQ